MCDAPTRLHLCLSWSCKGSGTTFYSRVSYNPTGYPGKQKYETDCAAYEDDSNDSDGVTIILGRRGSDRGGGHDSGYAMSPSDDITDAFGSDYGFGKVFAES